MSSPRWPPRRRWPEPSTARAAPRSPDSRRSTAASSWPPRPDGKGGWFVGGSFAKLNDVQVNGLAHILSNGTLDTNFQPAIVGTQNQPSKSFTVTSLALSGTWLYVGGEFTKFGARGNTKAQTRNHIARVSPTTGTVDADWNPDTGNNNAANPVRSIAVSPDGTTVYFAGDFSTVAGQPRPGLAAVVSDGSGGGRLSPWAPPVGAVSALGMAPDGRVYAGGEGRPVRRRRQRRRDLDGAVAAARVKQLAVARDGATVWVGRRLQQHRRSGPQQAGRPPQRRLGRPRLQPRRPPASSRRSRSRRTTPRVYFGGTFDKVKDEVRNNLAAVDASTGALTAWDPNATGAVSSLTASGALVYAGGQLHQPRRHAPHLPRCPRHRPRAQLRRRPALRPQDREPRARAPRPASRRWCSPSRSAPTGPACSSAATSTTSTASCSKNLAALHPARRRRRPELRPRRAPGHRAGRPLRAGPEPPLRRRRLRLDPDPVRPPAEAARQRRRLRDAPAQGLHPHPPEPLRLEAVQDRRLRRPHRRHRPRLPGARPRPGPG